jgi:hypothetical protein
MAPTPGLQVGIEHGADAADQRPSCLGHADAAAVDHDDSVFRHVTEAVDFRGETIAGRPIKGLVAGKVDGECPPSKHLGHLSL